MALVVFIRGVNVGGHRRFRPSLLAQQLARHDVVNIGAAGTLVVRTPGPRATLHAEILDSLPFEADIAFCDGRDLLRLETENPFRGATRPDTVRFVSILCGRRRLRAQLPVALPPGRNWLVRIVGSTGRFVFGEYRRDMKTIGYLGRIEKLFGVPTTTRNWNTIVAIQRVLNT